MMDTEDASVTHDATTIETLAERLRATPPESPRVDLWVPDDATLGGTIVPSSPTGIAAAILATRRCQSGFGREV
jgi:hypothetical protein